MEQVLEERRVVTALFADIAGSTAMTERLDPEEAKLVVGDAVARIVRIVDAYGGTIKDLAGDGVLALFGAPVAHEDDPVRALRAALEIVKAIEEYAGDIRRGWGIEDFGVRIGVDTGPAVVGLVGAGSRVEYGAVGDVVNTASRLQAATGHGGILAGETARRLAGATFDWGPSQSLDVRGKSTPVIAARLLGLRASALPGGTPDPVASAPIVGREAELTAGRAALERLADRRGGVLSIVGEPGIGKSRITAELARAGTATLGCTWLEGRCVSYGSALPYWPFRDLLRSWLGTTPQDPEIKVRVTLRRRIESLAPDRADELHPYLASLLGLALDADAAARLAQLSPEAMQYRTFEVVAGVLQAVAEQAPLVVALDDLHWADPTSLALVDRLFAVTEQSPLLLILVQRPETEGAPWALRERAAREYRHVFTEILLEPLSGAAESDLVDALVEGASLTNELRGRLLEYAEGNPFYLEELVRSLIDRDLLRRDGGTPTVRAEQPLAMPTTLEGVILARIDRLDPAWRELLTGASVLGRSFGLSELQAVLQFDTSAVRDAMHHLLRLDLVREDRRWPEPAYRFKHALIQEAAYRTLVTHRRAALHRRAADWFESQHQQRPERLYGLLAHHWRAADDPDRAMHYLRLAADHARDEWALDEAIRHYADLIPLLEAAGRIDEATELLFQLATMLHLAMRYREANRTWQQAFRARRRIAVTAPTAPPTATLRITTRRVPWMTDPAEGGFWVVNNRLHRQTHDPLLEAHPGPTILPMVADSWSVSDDGLTYQLRLREDAVWNDGRPVTAHDVVWTILHLLDPDETFYMASHWAVLVNAEEYAAGRVRDPEAVGVRAADQHTVELRLTDPVPHFVFMLAWMSNLLRPDGVGNGAFRVTSMDPERVVLERHPGHPGRRGGNVARIEWARAADGESVELLRRAEVDLMDNATNLGTGVSVDDLPGEIILGGPVQTIGVGFSGHERWATDVHLRRALALATDRRVIEPVLPPYHAIATGGLVPPGLPGHTPDIAIHFDPGRARQALRDSTHRGPIVALVIDPPPPFWTPLIATWTEVLGVEVELNIAPIEGAARFGPLAHAGEVRWLAHAPDPGYFLHLLHSRSRTNMSSWADPTFDALLDAARTERGGAARLDLYHQADRLVIQDEVRVIPLVYARYAVLAQPWVHGLWEWGAQWMSLDDVVIDERSPRFHGDPEPA